MKKRVASFFFTAPLVLMDMVFAVACPIFACAMRWNLSLDDMERLLADEQMRPYLPLIVSAPFLRAFVYAQTGLYARRPRGYRMADEIVRISVAVTLGSLIIVIMTFMYRGLFEYQDVTYSRYVLGFDWLLNIFTVSATHTLIGIVSSELRRRGMGQRRVAVQGTGETARSIMSEIVRVPENGRRVAGFISDEDAPDTLSHGGATFRNLGRTENLLQLINENRLNEIIVTDVTTMKAELMHLVDECHKRDVVVKLVPDLYGIILQGRTLEEVAGHAVVQVNEIAIEGAARFAKRTEDILVSLVGLIVLSPLLALTALLIRLTSPGPILFRQERVGKNGRVFTVYKFRSMYADAEDRRVSMEEENEADGLLFKLKKDPRVTPLGRVLRRTSIDEVPQLWNVLRGEMSLIGPRPLPVHDIEREGEWEHRRLSVLPGMTGLWQVNRVSHTSAEMLKWDLYYIEHWSLVLDATILLKTFVVVLTGRGAY